jgi:hypothetical protein
MSGFPNAIPPQLAERWASAHAAYERAVTAEQNDPEDRDALLALISGLLALADVWRDLSMVCLEPPWLRVALRTAEAHAGQEAVHWDQRDTVLATRPRWVPRWILPAWAQPRPHLFAADSDPIEPAQLRTSVAVAVAWEATFAEWERATGAARAEPGDPAAAQALAMAAERLAHVWRALAETSGLPSWATAALHVTATHTARQARYWDRRVVLLHAVRPSRRRLLPEAGGLR